MSPIPPLRTHRPTRTTFKNVCAWFAEKWKLVTGIVTACAVAGAVVWKVSQPVAAEISLNHANAAATQASAESIRAIQEAIDKRAAARDAQLKALSERLDANADALNRNNERLSVNNQRLDDTIKGQDETNKRLDTLTSMMLRQAMGRAAAANPNGFANTTPPTAGGTQ